MHSQKFKNLIHYIIWKCEEPTQLGATKLNKIPWFVDTFAFRLHGAPITGETYIKHQFGPMPKNVLSVLVELQQEEKIVKRQPRSEFQPQEYIARTKPDMSSFSPNELLLIDEVIETVRSGSFNVLAHDRIWDVAQIGEEIPVYAVLAVPGEITEDDKKWADHVIERIRMKRARRGMATS